MFKISIDGKDYFSNERHNIGDTSLGLCMGYKCLPPDKYGNSCSQCLWNNGYKIENTWGWEKMHEQIATYYLLHG